MCLPRLETRTLDSRRADRERLRGGMPRAEAAWALLVDVPRVVPCMPGATLEQDGRRKHMGGAAAGEARADLAPVPIRGAANRARPGGAARNAHDQGTRGARARRRGGDDPLGALDGRRRNAGRHRHRADAPGRRRAVRPPRRRQRRRGADAAVRRVPRSDCSRATRAPTARRHREAKPIGGIRLFFRALWAKLFRRS